MIKSDYTEFLVLWIMSTIMLTTVFMVIGLPPNSGPMILSTLWLLMCVIFFYRIPFGRMAIGYQIFLLILLTSILLGLIKALLVISTDLNLFLWNLVSKCLPKIIFLIFIYFLVSKLDFESINKVSYRYSLMLIFTIGLSLALYEIFPMNRFVWYHDRFAAFHFELVNFSFTAFTAGIILLYSHFKSRLIYAGMIFLSIAIYLVSKSNYVPIFICSLVFSLTLYNTPTNQDNKTRVLISNKLN